MNELTTTYRWREGFCIPLDARVLSPSSLLEMLFCSEAFFECWKKEVDGVVEDELGEVS